MKVIMLVDEEPFGKRGEIKEVKNGLARNYLLPKRLAIEATPGNIKSWELQKRAFMAKESKVRDEVQNLSARLAEVKLTIPVKVGGDEKIFGSVTSQEISRYINEKGFNISKKDIILDNPIKSLGEFDVKIKLHREVNAVIKVNVVNEDELG